MALILNIETATNVCSVAIGKDGELVALKEINEDRSHSSFITLFIKEVIKESRITFSNLDAIAVSKGPGSYTGLRIGVSTAKGLCYGLDKPMIAVNTLQSMASGFSITLSKEERTNQVLLCPMIDAKRMEVYTSFYNLENQEIRETRADIIDKNSYSDILCKYKVIFFGNGSSKCKETLSHYSNALFIDNISPSAKSMIPISEDAFNNKRFEDVAYFEPYYLKDFIAGPPKNSELQISGHKFKG